MIGQKAKKLDKHHMKKLFSIFTILLIGMAITAGEQSASAQSEENQATILQAGTSPDLPGEPQNGQADSTQAQVQTPAQTKQDFFKARIMEIKNEGQEVGLDGIQTYFQSYTLKPLDGKWKNQDIIVTNSEFNTIGLDAFKPGDVLIVGHGINEQNEDYFYVVDYVRESAMYILAFLFVGMVLLIGRIKGVKAILSLMVSFVVIIWFILPQIVHGADPVLTSVTGAIVITIISLYLTYGFKYFTHVGAASIGLSLIFTVIITQTFTEWTKLTGNVDEQAGLLTQMLGTNFNLKGLLLASFIIGAIGVLDDVVINQISLIEELHRADKTMSWQKLFQRGLKVGVDHISAIVNTLFLAYVGASLPLLLLFSADQMTKYDYSTIINVEVVATEIVRTLTGSLGLIFAVPIATFIAAIFIPKYFSKHQQELKEKTFSPHIH